MSKNSKSSPQPELPLSVISKIAGDGLPVLPGESAEEYGQGLAATIAELGATTPLQIYLAEKIFDAIWWIRRFEAQKQQAIVRKMWERLSSKLQNPPDHQLLIDGQWDEPYLKAAITALQHTPESLLGWAIQSEGDFLEAIDARIADRIRALRGLQSAFEALVNRKLMIERLALQNESLRKDLATIEVKIQKSHDH